MGGILGWHGNHIATLTTGSFTIMYEQNIILLFTRILLSNQLRANLNEIIPTQVTLFPCRRPLGSTLC